MNLVRVLIITVLLASPVFAQEERPQSESVPIEFMIESYAARTGNKFVLDPRVTGKVKLIGLSVEDIDRPTFLKILLIHSYSVIETEGVSYVLPTPVAAQVGERLAEVGNSQLH